MRARSILLTLAVTLLPAESRAQTECPCPASTPAVCYARDVVRSLGVAHRGAVRPDTAGAGQNVLLLAQAIMYAAQRQETALGDAQRILEPYAAARDSSISQSATLFGLAFAVLADFQSTSVAALKEQLDGTGRAGVGSTAERLAKLQMQRRQAAEALIAAAGGAADALTWMDPATGRASALTMTAAERLGLLADLRDAFGAALQPRNGQFASDYAAAAVAFRDFLANPAWKLRPASTRPRP